MAYAVNTCSTNTFTQTNTENTWGIHALINDLTFNFLIPSCKSEFITKIRKSRVHSLGYLDSYFWFSAGRAKWIITINWLLPFNVMRYNFSAQTWNHIISEINIVILFCFAVTKTFSRKKRAFNISFSF